MTSNDFRLLELKVGISCSADLKKAKAILERLLREEPRILTEEEHVVFVNDLGDSAVILGLRAQVKTENYWPTRWKLLEEIKLTFDAEGIEIPYPQIGYTHAVAGAVCQWHTFSTDRSGAETLHELLCSGAICRYVSS